MGADRHRWEHLALDNTSWLDVTWQLPPVVRHEFVPASDLGVAVVLVSGWPVVTSVLETSVAAEDDKVEVGDIVTHINDVSVVGATTMEKIKMRISEILGVTKEQVQNNLNYQLPS